jgi:imidazole glycerol-phosphate synthase subunit HisH
MITIVDYGAGNLFSIQNMFKKIGVDAVIATDELSIENAEKLVLPGVGSFDTCAEKLQQSGLHNALNKKVIENKIPVLGICVGMQLMTAGSEEGVLPGLGWIKGKTVKFRPELLPIDFKIPHMGWRDVELKRSSRLFDNMYMEPRFYFVHSYYVLPEDDNDVLVYAKYGHMFPAAIEHNNITGVQFHPEKSHKYGMKLLENFVKHY